MASIRFSGHLAYRIGPVGVCSGGAALGLADRFRLRSLMSWDAFIICAIQRAASLVTDVTVKVILQELRMGPRRFGELL